MLLNIFLFILAYFGCALAGYSFWYLKPYQKLLFVCLLVTWLIFGHLSWIVIVAYVMIFVGASQGFVALRDQLKEEIHEKQLKAKLMDREFTVVPGGKS